MPIPTTGNAILRTQSVKCWNENRQQKIIAITKMRRSTNIKEVRSFIGMVAYLRKFIKDLGKLTSPIKDLKKQGTPFEWTPERDCNFEKLKEILTTQPIL